jgi:hypothetical protein
MIEMDVEVPLKDKSILRILKHRQIRKLSSIDCMLEHHLYRYNLQF